MSIVVQSTSYAETTGTMTVPKPTGLTVGDLMVAHANATVETSFSGNWDTTAGWTSLVGTSTGAGSGSSYIGITTTVYYKFADSGDVSASSFTFNFTNFYREKSCTIYRITGAYSVVGTSGTTLTHNGNSLLLFLTTAGFYSSTLGQQPVTNSISDYAIVNNDPTWTEVNDNYYNLGALSNSSLLISGATGFRTQNTSTGTRSFSIANSMSYNHSILVALQPDPNVNLTIPVTDVVLSTPTPDIIVGLTLDIPTTDLNLSTPTPSVTTSENTTWTNETKPNTTWTNEQ